MPILDKIELELNSKINEWINVSNTINIYLQTIEATREMKERKQKETNALLLYDFSAVCYHLF